MRFENKYLCVPWIFYLFIVVKTIIDYLIYNPGLRNSDEVLLYATIFIILWVERKGILASIENSNIGYPVLGSLVAFAGQYVYIVGKIYPLLVLQIWGLFLMASGIVITLSPKENVKSGFIIGVSGSILVILGRVLPELLSAKMALNISKVTANIINATIFPVVSNGVYLYFGPYTAEVSHACSGMNSIFSIFALSLLYLKENVYRKYWHILILVLLVIPVSIVSNVIRVIILVLTTWFMGESFSSGIFHESIGIVVFLIALTILYLADKLLFIINNVINKKISES